MTLNAQPESSTRLHGRWPIIARAAWIVVALFVVWLHIATLPVAYDELRTVCEGADCPSDTLLTPADARALEQRGLSVNLVAFVALASYALANLTFFLTAAVLIWRRADDRMALFLAFFFPLVFNYLDIVYELIPSSSHLLVRLLNVLSGDVAWLVIIYAFPDGRIVPRWLTLVVIAGCVIFLGGALFPGSPLDVAAWPEWLYQVFGWPLFGGGVVSQIYRYRRASNPILRQQTKWVVVALAVVILVGGIGELPVWRGLPGLLVGLLVALTFSTLPLAFGIAILRYRLWDIDVIIRRTLVYSVLTGALGLVYFASVVLLQAAFRAITGQGQNQIVTVVSTLAIAALFAPLRRRVQDVIDRRFYRKKYDAAKVIAEFGATCRDETDLDKLTTRLVEVVQETMQPESVSLWLKPTETRPDRFPKPVRSDGDQSGGGK